MNRRVLPGVLVLVVTFGVVFWFLTEPPAGPSPRVPTNQDHAAKEVEDSLPAALPGIKPPAAGSDPRDPLHEPGPVPADEPGQLRFRLVDADAGVPIADTPVVWYWWRLECPTEFAEEVHSPETPTERELDRREGARRDYLPEFLDPWVTGTPFGTVAPDRRRTDGQGLVYVPSLPDPDDLEEYEYPFWPEDFGWSGNPDEDNVVSLPVPSGWRAAFDPVALNSELIAAFTASKPGTIDIQFYRPAELTAELVHNCGTPAAHTALLLVVPAGVGDLIPEFQALKHPGVVCVWDKRDLAHLSEQVRRVSGSEPDEIIDLGFGFPSRRLDIGNNLKPRLESAGGGLDEPFLLTDESGYAVWRGLGRGPSMLWVWGEHGSVYTFAVGVGPGENRVRVELPFPAQARLSFRVDARAIDLGLDTDIEMDEGGYTAHPLNVSLRKDETLLPTFRTRQVRSGGNFVSRRLVDHRLGNSWSIDSCEDELGVYKGTVSNLSSGTWTLSVTLHGPVFDEEWTMDVGKDGQPIPLYRWREYVYEARERVVLTPGQEQVIEIVLSPLQETQWAPVVLYDGQEIPGVELELDHGVVVKSGEQHHLAPGPYRVTLPGLPVQEIRLAPGETRKDVFHLPATTVLLSVCENLAKLVSTDGRVEVEVCHIINSSHPQVWERTTSQVLEWLTRQHGPGYRQKLTCRTGETVSLKLPPGLFEFRVAHSFVGWVDFQLVTGVNDTEVVHLSLDPGRGKAVLEIEFSGFEPGHEIEILVMDVAMFYLGRDEMFFAEDPDGFLDDESTVLRASEGRALVLTVPKDLVIELDCDEHGVIRRAAKAPGSLVITPSDFQAETSVLTLHYPSSEGRWKDVYFSEPIVADKHGFVAEIEYPEDLERSWRVHAVAGEVQIYVSIETTDGEVLLAHEVLTLTPGEHKLDLATLTYLRPGTVTIDAFLPGGPNGHNHPWMLAGSERSDFYRVSSVGGVPFCLRLDVDRRIEYIGHAPRISYQDVPLPAGRYRITPWQGAPPHKCIEFEVHPGQHTHVVVRP
jgi:hypothetical protein